MPDTDRDFEAEHEARRNSAADEQAEADRAREHDERGISDPWF